MIKVAIIGAGWVTTHRHLPALRRVRDASVVGIIDRDGTRAKQAARKHGLVRWAAASCLKEVGWLDEIDAVTIGTAPFTHYAIAGEALRLGKHVLTEKPFSMKVSEGEQLLSLSRETGKILAIVHNFQFARCFMQLKRDLANGALGKIVGVEATQLSNPRRRLPVWYEQLPGGLFFDESPHLCYLLRALGGGKPVLRSAFSHAGTEGSRTPAMLTATFSAPLGFPMRLSLNFIAPVSEWHVLVCGEKAMGCVDVFRDIYVRVPNDGLHRTGTVVRTSAWTIFQHLVGHLVPGVQHMSGRCLYGNVEVMSRFIDACATGTEPQGIGRCDALEVLSMQGEILASCCLS